MPTLHVKYSLFFLQNQYARQRKAKGTEMRLIEKVHLICVGKENQYVQARKPVECQKQYCGISLKCKKRGKHWWDMEKNCNWRTKRKTISRLY